MCRAFKVVLSSDGGGTNWTLYIQLYATRDNYSKCYTVSVNVCSSNQKSLFTVDFSYPSFFLHATSPIFLVNFGVVVV